MFNGTAAAKKLGLSVETMRAATAKPPAARQL
jgi:hypothetical protein